MPSAIQTTALNPGCSLALPRNRPKPSFDSSNLASIKLGHISATFKMVVFPKLDMFRDLSVVKTNDAPSGVSICIRWAIHGFTAIVRWLSLLWPAYEYDKAK